MNETAIRARAGILNAVAVITWIFMWYHPEWNIIRIVGPLVMWEMFFAAVFGLTPLAPVGVLATMLTLNMEAKWKPARPKRFAWSLGAIMGTACLIIREAAGNHWTLKMLVAVCFLLTWLEAVMGICVGCWLYARIFDAAIKLPDGRIKDWLVEATECQPCRDGLCVVDPSTYAQSNQGMQQGAMPRQPTTF